MQQSIMVFTELTLMLCTLLILQEKMRPFAALLCPVWEQHSITSREAPLGLDTLSRAQPNIPSQSWGLNTQPSGCLPINSLPCTPQIHKTSEVLIHLWNNIQRPRETIKSRITIALAPYTCACFSTLSKKDYHQGIL